MSVGDMLLSPKEKIVFNAPFIADQYSAVRLTNADAESPVGYRIKCEDPMRVQVKPVNGIIKASDKVDVRVDYRKFMYDPEQKIEDRLIIEWAKLPEGVTEFNNAWFDKSTMTRRAYLNIAHNT